MLQRFEGMINGTINISEYQMYLEKWNISHTLYMDTMESTPLHQDKYYYMLYTIRLNFLLMGIVPYVSLIVLTTLILRALLSLAKQRKNMFCHDASPETCRVRMRHNSSFQRRADRKSVFDIVDPHR